MQGCLIMSARMHCSPRFSTSLTHTHTHTHSHTHKRYNTQTYITQVILLEPSQIDCYFLFPYKSSE